MNTDTGPFLKVAALCESVIEGKDGVLSLIRVIDRLTLTGAGQEAPQEMPPTDYSLSLVLMLVSGRARGTSTVSLFVESPDTKSRRLWTNTVLFEGEDRGANIVAQVSYKFELQGLYWFHVELDGKRITSVPFRVIYQRVVPPMLSQ